jgi:hypothetical protein
VILDDSTSLVINIGYGRYYYTPPLTLPPPVTVLSLVTECLPNKDNIDAVIWSLPEGKTCSYMRDYNLPTGVNCDQTTITFACKEDGTFGAISIQQQCNGLGETVLPLYSY